jgi:P27 family predicted phage terminase small subunit
MKGRKKIPTALHLLRGNPGKHKLNTREPQPARLENLEPPAWLDADAQTEWNRVAPLLARLGVLTETDGDALAAYCEAFTTWKAATQRLRQFGLVVKRSKVPGDVVISPYVKIAHHAMAQMRAFLVEFGMTPSSRARIHTAAPADLPQSKWGGHL